MAAAVRDNQIIDMSLTAIMFVNRSGARGEIVWGGALRIACSSITINVKALARVETGTDWEAADG